MTASVMIWPRWTIALLLSIAMTALPAAARSAGVALVTDLQGKATGSSDGQTLSVTILAELQAGTHVQLGAGATLVSLYLDAGDEYVFKGPATIVFRAVQPEVLGGGKPEKRGPPLGPGGKDIRIKPVGVAQGALVMRRVPTNARLQLLDLQQTLTLDVQPEFRWRELRSSSSADFALASADLRAQAETLRPGASAPLSRKIAYAAWLDQVDLKDEARKYWQDASAERPEDPQLKALSAR